MDYTIVNIRTVGTPGKGQLSFFEAGKDIPFDIQRIYYICDVPKGTQRGGHAHKNLSQLMFCPYGDIMITLDDGTERIEIELDDPSKGLMISNLIWREMTWLKEDSVLTVAASSLYDPDDYIRDYDQFKACVAKKKALGGGVLHCSIIDLGVCEGYDMSLSGVFDAKRVYFTYGVPKGIQRGGHAHRKLTQWLTCPHGVVEVIVDDGEHRQTVTLDRPGLILEVGSMVWHDMVWKSEDAVLLVTASDYYQEADYIRDRSIFDEETR